MAPRTRPHVGHHFGSRADVLHEPDGLRTVEAERGNDPHVVAMQFGHVVDLRFGLARSMPITATTERRQCDRTPTRSSKWRPGNEVRRDLAKYGVQSPQNVCRLEPQRMTDAEAIPNPSTQRTRLRQRRAASPNATRPYPRR